MSLLERDVDEAEQYITILEEFLKSVDSQPEGTPIGPDHKVRIPEITCPRCQQPVSVNYEGYEYLWIKQTHLPGTGIEPESYCSFPYYLAELIIRRHPDWRSRLVSACNRCHEELHFSTRHSCSKR